MTALLFERQRDLLAELLRLAEERRRVEGEQAPQLERAEQLARAEAEAALAEIAGERDAELAELEESYQKAKRERIAQHRSDRAADEKAHGEAMDRFDDEAALALQKMEASRQDALWAADSFLEAAQKRVRTRKEAVEHAVEQARKRGEEIWERFAPLLQRAGLEREDCEPKGAIPPPEGKTLEDMDALLERAELVIDRAGKLRARRWLRWPVQLGLHLLLLGLGGLPALFLNPWPIWLVVGLPLGLLLAMVLRHSLQGSLERQMRYGGRALLVMLVQVGKLGEELVARAADTAKEQLAGFQHQHASNRQKAEARYVPQLEELKARLQAQRQALLDEHTADQERLHEESKQALKQLKRQHEHDCAECQARHEQRLNAVRSDCGEKLARLRRERTEGLRQTQARWQDFGQRFLVERAELCRVAEEIRGLDGAGRGHSPLGLPMGTMTVEVAPLLRDLPQDRTDPLLVGPVAMPAFLPFPSKGGLLLETGPGGKAEAIQVLQAMMLRFLTGLPPGKVRFTILDPVGLGDNFAAFMHLADHDENLVTSRIWTEPGHIEARLADLTEHMETVIQKYLRSQFASIEDYNVAAGEVAEPYRVLVVAGFPTNFSAQAIRRLVSILESGASCGVHALISVDTRQPLPQGFSLEELTSRCHCLRWASGRFISKGPTFERFPLSLDTPPPGPAIIETVRRIGALSRDAGRVEVPFGFIAPAEPDVWKGDSRRGISVPLGRAGAVRRLTLNLGRGTSQHVVVAGKTGSGKSTLWHAFIVNVALHYSPDEVELYLIDFKKGVEFKVYAEAGLPHARVIAIESEREFGLSVLQRLDAQLRERGDLFRAAGVNDVASYRDAHPGERCPRVLLVVDEFQEFFTEDDKLAQEAALLLDRLVRQGRAFGLHVLLGSQTLGGVYSLARSTIDQMAVRIALQCSETDAQLILHKDNGAARLLSRPGEAIFNDAGGSLEGNDLFQVVWLPDDERDRIVRSLHDRAEGGRRGTIVFESSAPARLEDNPLLAKRPGGAPRAWLGEAIAIKDPTAAVFRKQSGSNLLIIGQHEEAALGLLASSLVGLAVQHAPGTARFWVLDGIGADEPFGGYVPALLDGWPHPVQRVERDDIPAVLTNLAEEVQRRLKGGNESERWYLLVHGLQRFRDFRRNDDDMGFGRRGSERTVSPSENLQTVLRDGPSVGVHLLAWCDQLLNLNRVLDRQGLRECGLRVLFQMSAADSSNLIDSPLAARLGRNRALYFHDEMAQPEKFRPYDLPSPSWLRELQAPLVPSG